MTGVVQCDREEHEAPVVVEVSQRPCQALVTHFLLCCVCLVLYNLKLAESNEIAQMAGSLACKQHPLRCLLIMLLRALRVCPGHEEDAELSESVKCKQRYVVVC